jgi:hypothetical protein
MSAAAQKVRPKAAPAAPELRRAATQDRAALSGSPRYLRASLRVGGVNDPEERQAEHAASVIASGGQYKVHDPGGSGSLRAAVAPPVADPGAEGRIRRAVAPAVTDPGGSVRRAPSPAAGAPDAEAARRIEAARSAVARPLPAPVKARLEHGFGHKLDSVRVHSGPTARAAASAIGARAYPEGNRITHGHGESEHDLHLMAHEATHVVQNRAAVPQPPPARRTHAATGDIHRAATGDIHGAATGEIRRAESEPATASGPIRRFGIDTVLDFLADKANLIPGFRMFTIILGVNPVNMSSVDRSAANVLRAVVELMPGGALIVSALDKYGVFEKAGAWVSQQIDTLGLVGASIGHAVSEFIDSLHWRDALHPGDVWDRAKRIFTDPIDRIIAFIHTLVDGVIQFVKDAVLRPLADLASKTRAWDLLIALLGKNPITGDPVPQTAETLIGGFMKLIGQEEVWQNMQKSHAVARAFAWFRNAMATVVAFAMELPGLFLAALKSFSISDLLDLPGAIGRVLGMFGDFAGRFIAWAADAVWKLLEIIFDVVSPAAWGYIKKTGAALKSILKNPLPFVHNLVHAGKLAFQNFADHIGAHLKTGLIEWLTGAMTGVYIPKAFSLIEMGKFALSVLGITWAQIRGKIVKALGPTGEKIMAGLEKTFDVVVALVTGGPAAAWEVIKDSLTNLKDMVVDGVIGFVTDTIVKKAIPKIVSMFIPGAGFISAILSIYDTVMVFVQKLSKIIAAVTAFIDSIVSIAAGLVESAAQKVESTLASLLSLAISFLAGFLGLGNIATKIKEVIEKVRAVVDKALDKAIGWIVGKAKALFGKLFGGKEDKRSDEDKQRDLAKAVTELKPQVDRLVRKGIPRFLLAARLLLWKRQYKLTALTMDATGIVATINPTATVYDIVEVNTGTALEPILQRAETRFLGGAAGTPTLAAAQSSIAAGDPAPQKLTQIELITLLRDIRQNRLPVRMTQTGRQQYPRQAITDPAVQDYTVQVSGRPLPNVTSVPGQLASMQNVYVREAGRYMYSRDETSRLIVPPIPEGGRPMPLPVNVALRGNEGLSAIGGLSDVEVARHLGNLPANRVARALVDMGEATSEQAIIGRMAGMATGYSAAAGSFGNPATGTPRQIASAETVRRGSYAVIFQRLRAALNNPNSRLIGPQGDQQLVQLAQAFEQWLNTALNAVGEVHDTGEARRVAEELEGRLVAFLQSQQPR